MILEKVTKHFGDNLKVIRFEHSQGHDYIYQDGKCIAVVPNRDCIVTFIKSNKNINQYLNANLETTFVSYTYDDGEYRIKFGIEEGEPTKVQYYYRGTRFYEGSTVESDINKVICTVKQLLPMFRENIDKYVAQVV